jgi:PKD repeat protein
VKVTDDDGLSATDETTVDVLNAAPIVGEISGPVDPVQLNTETSFSADFIDPGILDTHTAEWDWGDETSSPGIVNETNGSGTVIGDHAYVEAGIYKVLLTVTDDDGGTGESVYQYVVVYDPDSGFVSGSGWFNSPAGAYTDDGDLAGQATFGFVSRYDRRAGVPKGETEFHFVTASFFKFHSDTYEWLVVAPKHRAMYQGTGTVWVEGEEQGSYSFRLTAIDGDLDGTGEDKFRIRIWDSGGVIYDNEMTAGEYHDPTTELGSGSIIIHSTNWKEH